MIKICLIGASGKMGRAVIEEANNYNDIKITNFIVHENSKALDLDVGKFHFGKADNRIFKATSVMISIASLILQQEKRYKIELVYIHN